MNPFQIIIAALNLASSAWFLYQHKWLPAALALTWAVGSTLVAFL